MKKQKQKQKQNCVLNKAIMGILGWRNLNVTRRASIRNIKIIFTLFVVIILSAIMGHIAQGITYETPWEVNYRAPRHYHLPQNPYRDNLTIEEQLRIIAKEASFKWSDYLVNMACQEGVMSTSTVNTAGNNPIGSRDRGLFGINDYWHPEVSEECAFDIKCSAEWTMWRIESGYQHEWMSDPIIKGQPSDWWKQKGLCVENNVK